MKHIQNFFIHLFGGLTYQESKESDDTCWLIGRYTAMLGIREYAKSINGLPADEWCRVMYDHIEAKITAIGNEIKDYAVQQQTTKGDDAK